MTINMIGQNSKQNDFQVQYDVSRWFRSARRVRVGQFHHSAWEHLSSRFGRHLLPQSAQSRQLRRLAVGPRMAVARSAESLRRLVIRPPRSIITPAWSGLGSGREVPCMPTSMRDPFRRSNANLDAGLLAARQCRRDHARIVQQRIHLLRANEKRLKDAL